MAALSEPAARAFRGNPAHMRRAGTFEMAPPNQPASYPAPARINDGASALRDLLHRLLHALRPRPRRVRGGAGGRHLDWEGWSCAFVPLRCAAPLSAMNTSNPGLPVRVSASLIMPDYARRRACRRRPPCCDRPPCNGLSRHCEPPHRLRQSPAALHQPACPSPPPPAALNDGRRARHRVPRRCVPPCPPPHPRGRTLTGRRRLRSAAALLQADQLRAERACGPRHRHQALRRASPPALPPPPPGRSALRP